MKILIWSTSPWCKTGYGKNCNYLMRALSENHEIYVMATYGLSGGSINLGPLGKVLPGGGNFWHMGSWLKYWDKTLKPDLVLQHFDLWTVKPGYAEEMSAPIATYMPVDSWPVPQATVNAAEGVADNVGMTKFAQEGFHRAGMESSTYIPHTVDLSTYYPEDKEKAKRTLGLPEKSFIIGIAGTNKGPRKNIPGQLLAFSNLLKNNPQLKKNTYIYLHSYLPADEVNPEGLDLPSMISYLGIEENTLYTGPETYSVGLDEGQMRTLYSAFDVLSEGSLGEGFGMPMIEAQACGTPILGTDFSAMPEVIGEGGDTIKISDYICWQRLGVFHALPDTKELEKAYLIYATQRNIWEERRHLAVENAKRFSFERWTGDWNSYVEKWS